MSERTITVRLTGPQYRALAYAVGMAEAELEGTNGPGDTQRLATLNRAWGKIKAAWNRNDQMPSVPASVKKLRDTASRNV